MMNMDTSETSTKSKPLLI